MVTPAATPRRRPGYSLLRIALAQVNATVGDIAGNAELVVRVGDAGSAAGAHVVAFPEMFLTGYPVEDLALRRSFIEASQASSSAIFQNDCERRARQICSWSSAISTARVTLEDRLGRPRHSPQNAAAVIHRGEVTARYAKHHLPNYGVFDEFRYFVPGTEPCTFTVTGHTVALAICEDLWQEGGPIAWARDANADLVLVINGSPYERNKDDVRLELCAKRSAEAAVPHSRTSTWSVGKTNLVFDGDSLGRRLLRVRSSRERHSSPRHCSSPTSHQLLPARTHSDSATTRRSTGRSSWASATTSQERTRCRRW